jgi:methyltransferase
VNPVLLAALAAVGLQRIAELLYAKRTAKGLAAMGARAVRPDGMLAIVAVHALFFAGCLAEGSLRGVAFGPWSAVGAVLFAVGGLLRYWSMATLRGRWSTRVWVLPEAPLVAGGPYRFLRHPIYIGVTLELLAFPLAFGLWATALAAPLLNLLAVRHRIAIEERALGLR